MIARLNFLGMAYSSKKYLFVHLIKFILEFQSGPKFSALMNFKKSLDTYVLNHYIRVHQHFKMNFYKVITKFGFLIIIKMQMD